MPIKVLAINDEVDTCSRCGKSGLKRVAWLYECEAGPATAAPVGLDCAAVLMGFGKRTKAGVPARAVQRVVLEHFADEWRQFLATQVAVEVSTRHGIGLRAGEIDFVVRHGEFSARSDSRHGLEHALHWAGQEMALAKMGEMGRRWRAATGLVSNPNRHPEWPLHEFLGRVPKLTVTNALASVS